MTRRIIAIGLAAVLAVIGAAVVLLYVNTADMRALAGKKAVTVLVATKRIPAGTSAEKVRTNKLAKPVRMPAESVPPGAMDTVGQELNDLVLTSEVQNSQLLLRGMFDEKVKSTGGLAVPDGKLAVSVQLLAADQVAGFIRPGATVAVFDTFNMVDDKKREHNGEGLVKKPGINQATRMVLSSVEVLAVGQYGAPNTKTSGKNTKTTTTSSTAQRSSNSQTTVLLVTVAVTQSEAERLIHAARTGVLTLALVTESSNVKPGDGVDNRSLFD